MNAQQTEILWRLRYLSKALADMAQNVHAEERTVTVDRSALAAVFEQFHDGLQALEDAG